MGKKKRQEFHNAFLENPKDQEGVNSCVHIAKGINLNRLKPKRNPKLQQKRLGILDSPTTEDKEPLWICLKCAQLECGRRQHTANRPADLHIISFNINTKKAWCNVCNIHFGPKDNQKVNRALKYLQQHLEDTYEEYKSAKVEYKILYEPEEEEEEEKEDFNGVVKFIVHTPRGLKNLGNTCYFNVVLQCLARTPNFISHMEKLKEERIIFLEANMLKDDSEKMTEVKLKMDKWMDFSDLLLKSLVELSMPERKPYVPIKLLNELHRVSNTITKDEQHDAHELLREVLQKIKEVDPQRLKSTILKNLKSPNTIKERMDDKIHHMIKCYENHTIKRSFLEEIFGGSLVSILKCQECGSTSYTNESFLDLSLPITDETITSFEMKGNKGTKHGSQQQKKNYTATVNKDSSLKNEETEHSEADVEDNFEQDTRNSWNEESGYDQENHEHSAKSPLSSRSPVPSIANDEEVLSLSSPCINSVDAAPAALAESSISSAEGAESKGKLSPEIKQKRRKNQSGIRPSQDKSPKYDASRLTLTYCLENFTALELMTDCEKVACSHCTEKHGKGETVFTTSTKQMRINSSPAVLILHLKRFEFKTDGGCSKTRKGTRPKKVNRHIQFPVVLDVSPYIYNENKDNVNLKPRQKESLYSLYAVIEHTGSINQGHYIVYIKSKAAKTDASHLKDVNENEYEQDGGISLPSKWFSISDESVQKVDEKDVLKSQAYILFYEKC